jgi:hypothetical protein
MRIGMEMMMILVVVAMLGDLLTTTLLLVHLCYYACIFAFSVALRRASEHMTGG